MERIDTDSDPIERFVDAGVRFELEGPRLAATDTSTVRRPRSEFASARVVVERHGEYRADRGLEDASDGSTLVLRTGGAVIEGRVIAARFEGRAVVSVDHPWPRAAIVLPVANAIAESVGGAVLHAAAVRVGDRALVFIGPSGSGKSTACTLVPGGEELAADRLLVVPRSGALHAFRMDGGTPTGLSLAGDGVAVAAIARVRHDGIRSGFVAATRAAALADLRAACLVPSGSDEARTIDRLLGIGSSVPVGTVYTRLDRDIDPRSFR